MGTPCEAKRLHLGVAATGVADGHWLNGGAHVEPEVV